MDTSELDEITKHLAELELYRPQSLSESMQKQSLVAEHKKNLNGLIPEDAISEPNCAQWRQVSDELRRDTEVVSSHIAQCTLPTVNRTQSRRVRLEEKDCLLIRQPLFSMYENVILEDTSQFFGLTGPQGFGTSAFLQYLTTKHIHGSNYLVVFLPVCPDEVGEMKIHLATAFYQGCRIAQLQGYPQLSRLAELGDMVRTCVGFAKGNNKTLLLVIDQMKTEDPQFFHPTINKISNVRAKNLKVVLSSSASHLCGDIFGTNYYPLYRYSHKLTQSEAQLLSTHYSNQGIAVPEEDLADTPFQVAAEKLSQMPDETEAQALKLAEDLLARRNDPRGMQAFFFLLWAIDSTKKDNKETVSFGTILNPDFFYVEEKDAVGGKKWYIAEHRKGFAARVCNIMRSRHESYEQYLLTVLGNPNFITLDRGAQGRIVEDSFSIILRSQTEIVFPLSRIPSGATNPNKFSVQAGTTHVVNVEGGDEEVPPQFQWPPGFDTLVFIPQNRQYKGINFIVARKTESSLFIYYVQCTVQLPQHHDTVESELYGGWEQLLVNAAALGVYSSQLVFLTPNSPEQAKGLTLPRIFASFFKSKALHIQFGDIKGDHQLVRAIKDRF